MSRWQSRVEDLLYEGESIRESVDVGTARVVVTSHRVLAFTPEIEGQNFRQADRPNVDGIETSALTEADLLERGLRFGIIGGVLILAGVFFDFGSIVGNANFESASVDEVGVGGLMSMAQSMMELIAQLDYLLRVFGVLALFLSAVLLGVYWFLRTPTLVIRIAGEGENIHVPRPEGVDGARNRLERAILPDPVGPAETAGVPDEAVPADPLQAGESEGVFGFLNGLFGDETPTPPGDTTPTESAESTTADTGTDPETETTTPAEFSDDGTASDRAEAAVDTEADGGERATGDETGSESEQESAGWREDL